jgi:magnesium transporter
MITEKLLTKRDFSWIDVEEPEDSDFERLNTEFNLPYLLVQDCLRPEHLPKYEESDEGHFLMLRSFDQDSGADDTSVQELTRKIALFITENRLITIHRVQLPCIEIVADKTLKKPEVSKTLHALIHQVILTVIRTYEAPIVKLQDLYDEFEHVVLGRSSENLSTTRIYHFRRQIFILKRILKQSNDALYRFKDFWVDDQSMLQDLRENIDQLYFQLDEVSDNFEHLFELHIALNEQKANEVMKILTVFSSILLPLNFIASFYGMNFTYLPGLDSPHALATITIVFLTIIVVAVWIFRKRGWFKTVKG